MSETQPQLSSPAGERKRGRARERGKRGGRGLRISLKLSKEGFGTVYA